VILATETMDSFHYVGIDEALKTPGVELRIFGKPNTRPYRRMGVALARGKTTSEAREKAFQAANVVKVQANL